MSWKRVSLPLVALTIALSACAHQDDATQRSAAQYSNDTTINTTVQTAVLGVPGIHAKNVQVSTYEGVVTLRGKAETEQAAQNAVQAARQVEGVKKVNYHIDVDD